MAEYLDLLTSLSGKQDFLGTAMNVGSALSEKAQDFLQESASRKLAEASAEIASSPVLTESFSTISTLNNSKYVITVVLIIWAVSLIVFEYVSNDPKQKEHLNYINATLLGNGGVLPMIFTLWIIVLGITIIIPSLVTVTPKLSGFLDNISTVFKVFLSGK